MSWWLADGLTTLRRQINTRYPGRDKASDGSIGDAAHDARTSDHNPDGRSTPPDVVRAIDVDEDLASNGGAETMRLAEHLRLVAKAGQEPRLKYLIYEGRICSLKSGWNWRPYAGSNPHKHHLHVSANARADHDPRPWSVPWTNPTVQEDDMPLNADDKKWLTDMVDSKFTYQNRTYLAPIAKGVAIINKNIWEAVVPRLDQILAKVTGQATGPVDYEAMGNAVADELADRLKE